MKINLRMSIFFIYYIISASLRPSKINGKMVIDANGHVFRIHHAIGKLYEIEELPVPEMDSLINHNSNKSADNNLEINNE